MPYTYHTRDDDGLDEEPAYDVCQGCGAYFYWEGVLRQRVLARLRITDGAAYQRCFKCLEA